MNSPAVSNRPPPVLAVPVEVFTTPGPVVSVCLTTESALPQAAQRVALRWKTLRAQLVTGGAPQAALTAIDSLIDGSYIAGEALFAVAGPDGLLYSAHLPEPPETDSAHVGPLPHLVPLLAATQTLLPHLVVVTDRLGAELIAVLPDGPDEHSEVDGDELHITRSAPGGWSQRRFQQRAENRWEANAREVSDALSRLVDATSPRLVVVSGDVRAVQFLREHVPARVAELLTEVQGDYSTLDEALHRSRQLVAEVAADDTAALLSDYRRGCPEGLAVTGPDETLAALHAGQVDTVLLDPTRTVGHTAWFGPALARVGPTPEALRAGGVHDPQPAPLADVVVRAAAATAATVRIMPAGTPELAPASVAALLRYP
ncbi:Vms1/Ankzf1 family peptidyl-tRNA hydrolase [Pseudonocardia sp. H11422]|uniref:baeRF2 domain-containing protein n=1 Tax=Pseudonocardia sp. H11422 TaxID=2835866 RepID=UPI001BDC7144|nr:Vms1/Ankzf1 family peptidyl-tRNA hydrolase [Pseudonocardia sp. H11422]